ncbi:unnamed protein product [Leptidea sinapis]|uniref:Uncharacterized protein n=1 Tax=Leptidea sinapis TaxID=189913 RepID=A0A5E4PPH5_9NEOP|nr:unnamed protein product [Leptidea sinapis]
MSDRTQSLSSINSSPMSSQLTENTITTSLKSYLKDLLKSRIFLGRYLERRLVNECVGYRDIVLLSAAETELKRDLHEAHEKLCTTGGTSFVSFIGDFTLGLLREISIFVNNSTPLVLGFLDFISKIVGGFYILMAMMFKPSRPVHIPNKRDIVVPNKHGGYNYYNDNSNSLNLD